MPFPKESMNILSNNEYIRQKLSTNLRELQFKVQEILPKLNRDQKFAYDVIIKRIYNHIASKNVFFINGLGGTGKTFLYSALLKTVRSNGAIELAVA